MIVYIILGVALIITAFLLFTLKKPKERKVFSLDEVYNAVSIETEELIYWFQKQGKLNDITDSTLSILIRPDSQILTSFGLSVVSSIPDKLVLIQGIYDKKNECMLCGRKIIVEIIPKEIDKMFDKKDMIIFK